MAANSAEIVRADTKAAILLGFIGAMLGAFMTVTRTAASGQAPTPGWAGVLWWSAVIIALLAVASFICALTPRRRRGRHLSTDVPGYFEHIAQGPDTEPLSRAFERMAHDPTGPLLASLQTTSEIIRAKYRWIETGIVLVLAALPQWAAVLRTTL
ncbi:Pycsar system effector family protein [Streptomyces chattanoogensis]|nr:Pycsar system effector family protein [Streptomyces chattanoogensis]